MYMCVYIYIYIYLYIYIYIDIYVYVYLYLYLSIYLSFSLSLSLYVYIYIYMYSDRCRLRRAPAARAGSEVARMRAGMEGREGKELLVVKWRLFISLLVVSLLQGRQGVRRGCTEAGDMQGMLALHEY